MAVQVTNVNISTMTFVNWIDKTNQALWALSNTVLTVAPDAASVATLGTAPYTGTGYAHVNGFLSANTVVVPTALRGGTLTASNTLSIISSANLSGTFTHISSNLYAFGANVTINASQFSAATDNTFITSTGNVTVSSTSTNINANTNITGAVHTVAGNVNFDSATLFVDAANNRVGIGTSTPNANLQVTGTANVTGAVILSSTLTVNGNTTLAGPNTYITGTNTAIVPNTTFTGAIVTFGGGNVVSTANISASGANSTISSTNTRVVGTSLYVSSVSEFAANVNITGTHTHTVAGNVNFDSNTLFVDAANNRIGIGTSTPNAGLQVSGTANVSGNVVLSSLLTVQGNTSLANTTIGSTTATLSSNVTTLNGNTVVVSAPNTTITSTNTRVTGTSLYVSSLSEFAANVNVSGTGLHTVAGNVNFNTNTLFVDASNSRVGILTAAPTNALTVNGSINTTLDVAVGRNLTAANSATLANTTLTGTFANIAATTTTINGTTVNGVANVNITAANTTINSTNTRIIGTTLYVSSLSEFAANINVSGTGLHTVSGNVNFDQGVLFVDGQNNRVGVGTTAPTNALSVTGSMNVSDDASIGRNLTVSANSSLNGSNTTVGGYLRVNNRAEITGNTTLSGTRNDIGGNTAFVTNVLFVDASNSRVGIGTTTPNTTLQVNGAANVSGLVTVSSNIVTSANVNCTTLNASGNVVVTSTVTTNDILVTGNTDYTSIARRVVSSNNNIGASTSSAVPIYTFPYATFSSGKFTVQVKNGTSTQTTEMLVVGDSTDSAVTAYASVSRGTANLGVFSALSNTTSGNIELRVQQTIASSAVKLHGTLIRV